jgi:predicted enzyme related to lactoylglutathione lyase
MTTGVALMCSGCAGQIYKDAADVEPRDVQTSVDDTLSDQRCEERAGPWSPQTCPPSERAKRAFDERRRLKAATQDSQPSANLPQIGNETHSDTAPACDESDANCTNVDPPTAAATSDDLLETLSANLNDALTANVASRTAATTPAGSSLRTHYLEFVTEDVDARCDALAKTHTLTFSAPVAELGFARVAQAADGTLIGVRAPLGDSEKPIIRTYKAVDDINAAIKKAEAAGAVVAYPPTQQGDTGTWAIYILDGEQFGLWQKTATK